MSAEPENSRYLVERVWLLEAASSADALERTACDAEPRVRHVEAATRAVPADFALPYLPVAEGNLGRLRDRLSSLLSYAETVQREGSTFTDLDLRPAIARICAELRACEALAARSGLP